VLFFVALTCLAAATFGSVLAYQRGEQRRLQGGGGGPAGLLAAGSNGPRRARGGQGAPTARPDGADEPTLTTLAPGDVVTDGVDDWVVSGSVRYREESDAWALHVLDGGAVTRFLEVRARRGVVEVALVDPAPDLPRGQLAGGLTFRGQLFSLEGRGDARTSVVGDVAAAGVGGGVLQWARYASPGGGLLLVEDEGPLKRGFFGALVQPSSLSILSGELNRASADNAIDDPS